ncbi:16S rRNA (uracil(1498)-N(3))-methyltransferase [Desulfovibrio sp. SGI.169]|uniref:16S rRNA (uracil(1498)-N(3))-methyltransferase n=1 Tax=Desulfovibrio sp. SGI.169 TaxID=3420561 RepID=UPI003D0221DC
MSGPFFYLPPEAWGHEVSLEGQEARHVERALRLGPGAEVGLLDGCGRAGRFVIRATCKKNVRLECLEESFTPQPASLAVMALAFSKAVRRGFFMEKAAELGAHAVWLWQGDHSQGKLPAGARESCLGQMIAGIKQSGNPWLPEVRVLGRGVEELAELSRAADQRILPWEMQKDLPMLTPDMAGRPGLSVYAIGPEGGFSGRELDILRAAGFSAVSLGARVLRCETAATLCLGIHWWASQLPGRGVARAEG